jgi:hypothetical protein
VNTLGGSCGADELRAWKGRKIVLARRCGPLLSLKASRPLRLRMFPDAGHNSGNTKGNNIRRHPGQSGIVRYLADRLRMDLGGLCRMTFSERGFDSLTVHVVDYKALTIRALSL